MTDDDGGGNLYENHSKLCLIYNQKSRCVEKKSIDISHTHAYENLWSDRKITPIKQKYISESILNNIECMQELVLG